MTAIQPPKWLVKMDQRRFDTILLRNRFYIKACALHYSEDGKFEALAAALGIAYSTLPTMYSRERGTISAEMAVRIEKLMGADVITRQMLRPDLYE